MADDYPEHAKLHLIQDKSQAVHDFMEWLYEKHGVELAKMHTHTPNCPGWDPDRERYNPDFQHRCDFKEGSYYACLTPLRIFLAEFFEIDLGKLEAEKEQLLEEQRRLNERTDKHSG